MHKNKIFYSRTWDYSQGSAIYDFLRSWLIVALVKGSHFNLTKDLLQNREDQIQLIVQNSNQKPKGIMDESNPKW